MAVSGSVYSILVGVVSDLWTEVVMFGLAALVYLLFVNSGRASVAKPTVKQQPKESSTERNAAEPQRQATGSPRLPTPEEGPVVQAILRSLRLGNLSDALATLVALPKEDSLPPTAAGKVLLALGQSPALDEEVVDRLMDLAGRFDPRALETIASEASRRGLPAAVFRQLYSVAGVASIPKTDRAIFLLAKGMLTDVSVLREFVEEIVSEGSGVPMTRSLMELLNSVASTSKDSELTRLLQDRLASKAAASEAARQARVISQHGREGNLKAAIEAFTKLRDSGAPLSSLVYNCLLDACAQGGDMKTALEYFKEMKAAGLVDIVSYNTLMKGHLATRDVQAARALLVEMRAAGLPANRITYHGLLNALVQRGDMKGMWQLVGEMQDAGMPANAVTCSILLKTVTTPNQAPQLERIVSLIDASDAPVDEVLFASFVEACIRAGSLKLLLDRTRLYGQQGGLLKLSAPTYGSMFKAFGQAHDIPRIWDLWAEMLARQVKPTSITLGCMVEALVVNNQVDGAWKLAQELWEDAETRPMVNTVVYSSIIKGFAVTKRRDRIVAVYAEMKQRNIKINMVTYNTLLNALVRCGMMNEVPQLLEEMRRADPSVEPDIVTYSTIIKGYCLSGELDKSFQLLEDMKRTANIMPDEVMYNSLLDGCAKQQRLEDALRLISEMRAAGLALSNYTLSIITKLLGRARRLEDAFAMVDSVSKEHNFQPNIQVYTCLIQACFHNRQLGRALSLHDKVVCEGFCTPDEKTYTVLTRGCLQAGAMGKAVDVVRCAYHLPGTSLQMSKGSPQGIEATCLQEVVAELNGSSATAKALLADLELHRGVTVAEAAKCNKAPRQQRSSARR